MSLQTPLDGSGGYLDALKNSQLDRENAEIQQKIAMMREQQGDDQFLQHVAQAQKGMIEKTSTNGSGAPVAKKRNRWDDAAPVSDPNETPAAIGGSAFDTPAEVPINSSNGTSDQNGTATQSQQQQQKKRRRARWDQETPVQQGGPGGGPMDTPMGMPNMDTPMMGGVMDTPMGIGMPMDTPMGIGLPPGGTPSDNIGGGPPGTTPVATGANQIAVGATPTTVDLGQTPLGVGLGMMDTPIGLTPHPKDMTPDQLQAFRILRELDDRNRPLSDQELDQMFPPGYEVVPPPPGYDASAQRKINVFQTPLGSTPIGLTPGFGIGSTPADGGASLRDAHGVKDSDGSGGTGRFESTDADGMGGARGAGSSASQQLPEIKPEERHHFAPLLKGDSEDDLSPDEAKQRRIMRLLLKIKNGDPAVRRSALKEITNKAREFGAGPLFDQILPLMMISSLEEQERHLLVKVIDRILHRLGDLVRPFVHKILVVIEPLLIDEDHVARVEGREIIANLSKSAGLATMISTMRPDLDHPDEYVRNTTARAFAVVASALGIPSLLLFLKAVCNSKKTWQGRHTGVKIIQQIAILMGIQILPYLKQLVDLCAPGLSDEQRKVRTMSALALAALAEASSPYGLESFDQVLRPLWRGIREHQGKDLGSFFKCIGYILGLFPPDYASHYIRELGPVLIREFGSSDEEMRRIVLKVVHQCVSTEGVDSSYIQDELLFPFFRNFWVPRMALDRRNSRQLVETTVALAEKVGGSEICSRILHDLKDSNELYRSIVLETIALIVDSLGVADFDSRTEELLVDGSIYCFHESSAGSGAAADIATSIGPDGQPITNSSSSGSAPANLMLNSVSSIIHALGSRFKPYVPQITGVIRFRLNTPQPMVRKLAADLISRIAAVLKICGEEGVLLHFGLFLYEYLGEEYPDVLASIIGALKSIVSVVGQDISELDGSGAAYKANNSSSGSGSLARMTPPIKDLLPRLTPILKNRHEKVQEQCISLVGRIADKGSELAPPREWNRICFDLVELLKATKKSIRRAAVNTFGLIASAIGPHDVLATLINNLKVQERQMRVCTCIALGIIGETCGPFTILPAILNEYKTADLNVQHGVLKTLQFLLQYIGSLSKDYIYAITPLLEDALTDRDSVHRQMGIVATMHLTLGVQGLGREDACIHLLNYVFPNAFETTPHLIQGVFGCFDAMRVTLGPTKMLQYLLQGLFHPARRVREVYWKLYNQLYIGAQEGMVPSYPKLRDQVFHRPQLELLL